MKLNHGGPFKIVGSHNDPSDESLARKLIKQIPNLLTFTAVLCGLSAIHLSGVGEFALAMTAILSAAALDAADGWVARKLSAESAIGAELDSLADFLNFGVAPAMLLYDRHLYQLGLLGWMIASLYVMATGYRLARFNVQIKTVAPAADKPRPSKKWFCGLPSTGAAMAIMGADAAALRLHPSDIPVAIAGVAVAASALMVSTLPVPSLAAIFAPTERKR
jgi:CDP-diacylglycerol---serine O-phosphatidyltransferase